MAAEADIDPITPNMHHGAGLGQRSVGTDRKGAQGHRAGRDGRDGWGGWPASGRKLGRLRGRRGGPVPGAAHFWDDPPPPGLSSPFMGPDHAHKLPTDTPDGLLLIISGPSGVGKTTITRGVERSIAGSVFSVSVTTRQPTEADVEGVDYHFASEEEFDRLVERDELLEWANVFGKRYGTPRQWVLEQLRRGRLVILEIDVEGARQVKARAPEAFAIFILPPSEKVLLQRLRDRKRESEGAIQQRFAEAKREIAVARASGVYDRFIVNDDLHRAIEEAVGAVEARRSQVAKHNPDRPA